MKLHALGLAAALLASNALSANYFYKHMKAETYVGSVSWTSRVILTDSDRNQTVDFLCHDGGLTVTIMADAYDQAPIVHTYAQYRKYSVKVAFDNKSPLYGDWPQNVKNTYILRGCTSYRA